MFLFQGWLFLPKVTVSRDIFVNTHLLTNGMLALSPKQTGYTASPSLLSVMHMYYDTYRWEMLYLSNFSTRRTMLRKGTKSLGTKMTFRGWKMQAEWGRGGVTCTAVLWSNSLILPTLEWLQNENLRHFYKIQFSFLKPFSAYSQNGFTIWDLS